MERKPTRLIHTFLAYLYFFINGAGLKGGLLLTNILTPFFYLWAVMQEKKPLLWPFFIVIVPYDIIHIIMGVNLKSLLISTVLLLSTYIFVVSFIVFIRMYRLERIMKQILLANIVVCFLAILFYYTPFKEVFWYKNKFTRSVDNFYRMAQLTTEASYYALMFVPVAFYYILKVFFRQNQSTSSYVILLLVFIPLALSLSIGVIGAMAIAMAALVFRNIWRVVYKKNYLKLVFFTVTGTVFLFFVLLVFFPDNALFVRFANISGGLDTSANGRTVDSFKLGWLVAGKRSYWFGAGLGQIKVIVGDIIRIFLPFWGEQNVFRIPNAIGETLAIFGISGLLIRFFLIGYFFLKTRVLANHYRFTLFVFIFVYQFTGSFITNIIEYVIWCLAFSDVFPQFDAVRKGSRLSAKVSG